MQIMMAVDIFSLSLTVYYGVVVGLFLAAFIYMLVFALTTLLWKGRGNLIAIFSYAMGAFGAFGLFNIYCLQLHYPPAAALFPSWLLFLGKLSIPIGVYTFIKMFIHAAPIKSMKAFLFWHHTRSLYQVLYGLCALTFAVLLFTDDLKVAIFLSFMLIVVNCIVGVFFASTALESKRLSVLYAGLLAIVAVILFALATAMLFMDISVLPPALFQTTHMVFGAVVLLLSFVIMRYSIDETLRFSNITKLKVENFFKEIYNAIKQDEFFLEYQPKVDLKTMQVSGVEALIRWQNPETGRINPDEFIPDAEQTHIIDDICKWTIETAIKDTTTLLRQGIKLPVAINFSVNNIHPDMVGFLQATLQHHQLPPDMVMVEITESLFLDLSDEKKAALEQLRAAGIPLSLDDFGAGFSSLRHLDEMGLTEVKIDKSFIFNLSEPQKQMVVQSLLNMSHALGISVIAEGVENHTIQSILSDMNCDSVQGYGICRPKSLVDLVKWYDSYRPASV